ncbi:hypothetical protein A3731_27940 [Roseovarius sp. HI0049]|nr:hypothetical protein A3731_27940 [Roseovarius sp. HI0049]
MRREEAESRNGHLVSSGLNPLPVEDIARRAHEGGYITGVTEHTFNRWAWARTEFDVECTQFEGHRLYVGLCAGCHGADGEGPPFGPFAMLGKYHADVG